VNDARGLAAGFSHLCVLRGWGGVECFLPADRNQPYGVPVSLGTVPGLTGALALAASGSTACALGADRRVRCWNIREDTRRMSGLVDLGVEGALDLAGGDEVCVAYARSAGCLRDVWPDEAGAVHAELHEKAGLRQLSALSSGGLRWCGQRADGALVCWGSDDGTLGRYSQFESQPVPLAVAGLASAAELAVIERGVCARRSDGRVLCWGGSEVAREVEQGAARLESGQRFVCKIAADGAAACWGERSWEPCWWHSEDNCQAVHTASALPGDLMGIPGAIAVGDPCALRGDGKVVCPVVETDRKGAPEVVAGVSGARAVAGACALDGQGGVACWGERPRVAQRVALPAASQVVTGQGHACALVGGAVWCWGRGESGQLGDGTRPLSRAAAAPVRGLADAVELAAGDEFTCARRAGGGVVCWGRNVHGALGDGSGRDQAQPAVVAGLSDAVEVAARAERACARRAGGGVVCWGWHPAEQYLEVTAEAPVLVARP